MARRVYVKRNSRSEDWAALFVVAIAVVYAQQLLVLAFIIVCTWALLKYLQHREQVKMRRMANNMMISLEADHQDMLAQQGDPAGVYGRYDAYTMPLTRDILDNYDDGLRGWR